MPETKKKPAKRESEIEKALWWGPAKKSKELKTPSFFVTVVIGFELLLWLVVASRFFGFYEQNIIASPNIRQVRINDCFVNLQCTTLYKYQDHHGVVSSRNESIIIDGSRSLRCHVDLCVDPNRTAPLHFRVGRVVLNLVNLPDKINYPIHVSNLQTMKDSNAKVFISDLEAPEIHVNISNGIVQASRVTSPNVTFNVDFGPVFLKSNFIDPFQVNAHIEDGGYCVSQNMTSISAPDCGGLNGSVCPFFATFNGTSTTPTPISSFDIRATSIYIQEDTGKYLNEHLYNATSPPIAGPGMEGTQRYNSIVANKLNNTLEWSLTSTIRDYVQAIEIMTPSLGVMFLNGKKRVTMEIGPEWLSFISAYALRVHYRRITSPLNHYRCRSETPHPVYVPASMTNFYDSELDTVDYESDDYRQMLESYYPRADQFETAQQIFENAGNPTSVVVFVSPETDHHAEDHPIVSWSFYMLGVDSDGDVFVHKLETGFLAWALLVTSSFTALVLCIGLYALLYWKLLPVLKSFLLRDERELLRVMVDYKEKCPYHYFFSVLQVCSWFTYRMMIYAYTYFPVKAHPFVRFLTNYFLLLSDEKNSSNEDKNGEEDRIDTARLRALSRDQVISQFEKYQSLRFLVMEDLLPEDVSTMLDTARARRHTDHKLVVQGLKAKKGVNAKFQLQYSALQTFYEVTGNPSDQVMFDDIFFRCIQSEASRVSKDSSAPPAPIEESHVVEKLRQWNLTVVSQPFEILGGFAMRDLSQFTDAHLHSLVDLWEWNHASYPSLSTIEWHCTGNAAEFSTRRKLIRIFLVIAEVTLITAMASAVVLFAYFITLPLEMEHARYTTSTSILLSREIREFTEISAPRAKNVLSRLVFYIGAFYTLCMMLEPFLVWATFRVVHRWSEGRFYHPRFWLLYIRIFLGVLVALCLLVLTTFVLGYVFNVIIWWVLGAVIQPHRMLVFASSVFTFFAAVMSTLTNLNSMRETALNRLKEKILEQILVLVRKTPAADLFADNSGSAAEQMEASAGKAKLSIMNKAEAPLITSGLVLDAVSDDAKTQENAIEAIGTALQIPQGVLFLAVALIKRDPSTTKDAVSMILSDLKLPKAAEKITLELILQMLGLPASAVEITHELYRFVPEHEPILLEYDAVLIPIMQCMLNRSFDERVLTEAVSRVVCGEVSKITEIDPQILMSAHRTIMFFKNKRVVDGYGELAGLLSPFLKKVPKEIPALRHLYTCVLEGLKLAAKKPNNFNSAAIELLRAANLTDDPFFEVIFPLLQSGGEAAKAGVEVVENNLNSSVLQNAATLATDFSSSPFTKNFAQQMEWRHENFKQIGTTIAQNIIKVIRSRFLMSTHQWNSLLNIFSLLTLGSEALQDLPVALQARMPLMSIFSSAFSNWYDPIHYYGARTASEIAEVIKSEKESAKNGSPHLWLEAWLADQWLILDDMFSLRFELRSPSFDYEALEELVSIPVSGLNLFRSMIGCVTNFLMFLFPEIQQFCDNPTLEEVPLPHPDKPVKVEVPGEKTPPKSVIRKHLAVMMVVNPDNRKTSVSEQTDGSKMVLTRKAISSMLKELCNFFLKETGITTSMNFSFDENFISEIRKGIRQMYLSAVNPKEAVLAVKDAFTARKTKLLHMFKSKFKVPDVIKTEEQIKLQKENSRMQLVEAAINVFLEFTAKTARDDGAIVKELSKFLKLLRQKEDFKVPDFPLLADAEDVEESLTDLLTLFSFEVGERVDVLGPSKNFGVTENALHCLIQPESILYSVSDIGELSLILLILKGADISRGLPGTEDQLKTLMDRIGVADKVHQERAKGLMLFCAKEKTTIPASLERLLRSDVGKKSSQQQDSKPPYAEEEPSTATTQTTRWWQHKKSAVDQLQYHELKDAFLQAFNERISMNHESIIGLFYTTSERDAWKSKAAVESAAHVTTTTNPLTGGKLSKSIEFADVLEACYHYPPLHAALIRLQRPEVVSGEMGEEHIDANIEERMKELLVVIQESCPRLYNQFMVKSSTQNAIFDSGRDTLRYNRNLTILKDLVEESLLHQVVKKCTNYAIPQDDRSAWEEEACQKLDNHGIIRAFSSLSPFSLMFRSEVSMWIKNLFGILSGITHWYPDHFAIKLSALLSCITLKQRTPSRVLELLTSAFPIKHRGLCLELMDLAIENPNGNLSAVADLLDISVSRISVIRECLIPPSAVQITTLLAQLPPQDENMELSNVAEEALSQARNNPLFRFRWISALREAVRGNLYLLMQHPVLSEVEELAKSSFMLGAAGGTKELLFRVFPSMPISVLISNRTLKKAEESAMSFVRQFPVLSGLLNKILPPVTSSKAKALPSVVKEIRKFIELGIGSLYLMRLEFVEARKHFDRFSFGNDKHRAVMNLVLLSARLVLEEGAVNVDRIVIVAIRGAVGLVPTLLAQAPSGDPSQIEGSPSHLFMTKIYPFISDYLDSLLKQYTDGVFTMQSPQEMAKLKVKEDAKKIGNVVNLSHGANFAEVRVDKEIKRLQEITKSIEKRVSSFFVLLKHSVTFRNEQLGGSGNNKKQQSKKDEKDDSDESDADDECLELQNIFSESGLVKLQKTESAILQVVEPIQNLVVSMSQQLSNFTPETLLKLSTEKIVPQLVNGFSQISKHLSESPHVAIFEHVIRLIHPWKDVVAGIKILLHFVEDKISDSKLKTRVLQAAKNMNSMESKVGSILQTIRASDIPIPAMETASEEEQAMVSLVDVNASEVSSPLGASVQYGSLSVDRLKREMEDAVIAAQELYSTLDAVEDELESAFFKDKRLIANVTSSMETLGSVVVFLEQGSAIVDNFAVIRFFHSCSKEFYGFVEKIEKYKELFDMAISDQLKDVLCAILPMICPKEAVRSAELVGPLLSLSVDTIAQVVEIPTLLTVIRAIRKIFLEGLAVHQKISEMNNIEPKGTVDLGGFLTLSPKEVDEVRNGAQFLADLVENFINEQQRAGVAGGKAAIEMILSLLNKAVQHTMERCKKDVTKEVNKVVNQSETAASVIIPMSKVDHRKIGMLLKVADGDLDALPELITAMGVAVPEEKKAQVEKVLQLMSTIKKIAKGKLTLTDTIDIIVSQIFKEFDVENTGKISFQVFSMALKRMRLNLTPQEAKLLFTQADADESGFITEDEFRGILTTVQRRFQQELIAKLSLSKESIYIAVGTSAIILGLMLTFILLGVFAFADGSDFTAVITGILPACSSIGRQLRDPNALKLLLQKLDEFVRIFFERMTAIVK